MDLMRFLGFMWAEIEIEIEDKTKENLMVG